MRCPLQNGLPLSAWPVGQRACTCPPAGRVLNEGDVFTAAGTNFQIRYTANVATLTTNGGYSVVIQVTSQASTTASKGTLLVFK